MTGARAQIPEPQLFPFPFACTMASVESLNAGWRGYRHRKHAEEKADHSGQAGVHTQLESKSKARQRQVSP
jgi:hypothetical protein